MTVVNFSVGRSKLNLMCKYNHKCIILPSVDLVLYKLGIAYPAVITHPSVPISITTPNAANEVPKMKT